MEGFITGFIVAYLAVGAFIAWRALPGAVEQDPYAAPVWAWMITAMLAVLVWSKFMIDAGSK